MRRPSNGCLAIRYASDHWSDSARSDRGNGAGSSAFRAKAISARAAKLAAALPPLGACQAEANVADWRQLAGAFRGDGVGNCDRAQVTVAPACGRTLIGMDSLWRCSVTDDRRA